MDGFTISLAEIPIGIKPLGPDIQSYFSDYLCCETPRFTVSATEKDLEYEQAMQKLRNGEDFPPIPQRARNIEASALLRLIAERIPEYGVILFHGSAVAVDGKAYLFAARSGVGKTTHTRLWLKLLPQAYVLNGDKPFLKLDGSGRVLVCGTPWRGKEKLGRNEILPLGAICLLERAKENRICSLTPAEANRELIHQVHFPEGAGMVSAIQVLDRISSRTPLFRLGCNMDPQAAQISIHAMIPDLAITAFAPAEEHIP